MTDVNSSEKENIAHFFMNGIRQESEKHYKGAIEDYTKAIEIDPNKFFAYRLRADAKRKL